MRNLAQVKKIIVAMDSMKGCLGSFKASAAAGVGIKRKFPDSEIKIVSVSDGGEGMVDMVAEAYPDSEIRRCKVHNPLGQITEARWLSVKLSDHTVAFMDFASACGLTLIAPEKRNPLLTSSYGVGEMIVDAINSGIKDIRLGLGGSATVDGGLGILQALGLEFLDSEGRGLPAPFSGGMLGKVATIVVTERFKKNITDIKLTLLCDVTAPFSGKEGAALVFGPQKGADEKATEKLEHGMRHLRDLLYDMTGVDLNLMPGSGAAGGAAGGLMALTGARIVKGASALLDVIGFNETIDGASLIVTGEGMSDRQTLMGKIPFEILRRGLRSNIPVLLVAGIVKDEESLLKAGFDRVICINSPEIIDRSNTRGENPLNPEVARARLSQIF